MDQQQYTDKSEKPPEGDRKRRKRFPVFRAALLSLILVAVICCGWAWTCFLYMYRNADISLLEKEPPCPTIFYDRNGGVMTELTNAKIEYMPISKFPKTMLDAITAVEDFRFYEHKGIDFYAVGRALYRNFKSGDTVEGGSTITQQLAKITLFSTEQTYSRKINEAVASLKIERTYSKEQILELYLNHIYFGEGAWGLERAAQIYFGKSAPELTLTECALLAGIPKSPTNYSPVDNPQKSKDRRNLVLKLMAEQGKITEEERDAAKSSEIKLADKTAGKTQGKYASYVDHAIHEAIDKYGLTEQQILTAGLHIYTNLDPKVQEAAETVYKEASFFPEDRGGLQSGIVLMEQKSGAVLGIVGSRSQNREFRGFNYATQAERQPGSTIKPLMVYAPALAQGYGPQDMIYDEETDFGGGYKPMNYKKQFHGWVTMEEALIQSYNIPAVALLKEIGINKGFDFAKKAGLPLQSSDKTLGIALGGMQKGTSPLQMAQAYTIFAGGGKMSKAFAVTKITDKKDHVVAEAKPEFQQLLDPNLAYTMTQMMEKVVTEGTGQNAMMDRPVAGKTGTTQLPDIAEFKDRDGNVIDGSRDAWFVGYTPEIVAAVWLGYQKTNKDHYLTTTGGKYPASIFKEVVSRALQDAPVTAFAEPESYVAALGGDKRINGDALLAGSEASRKKSVSRSTDDTARPAPIKEQPDAAREKGQLKPADSKDVASLQPQPAAASPGGAADQPAAGAPTPDAAASGGKNPAPPAAAGSGSAAAAGKARPGTGTAAAGTAAAGAHGAGAAGSGAPGAKAGDSGTAGPAAVPGSDADAAEGGSAKAGPSQAPAAKAGPAPAVKAGPAPPPAENTGSAESQNND